MIMPPMVKVSEVILMAVGFPFEANVKVSL